MRFAPTSSEASLWSRIRGKRLGVQFRRQVVLQDFIVDFLAPAIRLVVEVDGDAYHASRASADARRDRKLTRAGYRVLRLPASLVERDLEEAVRRVREAVEGLGNRWTPPGSEERALARVGRKKGPLREVLVLEKKTHAAHQLPIRQSLRMASS